MRNLSIIFMIMILIIDQSIYSQKEYNNWYFGDHAAITFNSGSPIALNNSQTTLTEASASISDTDGNLLFYTQGITVYNKNNQIMLNGAGLLGYNSSSQIQIAPQPGNTHIYYIFTVDAAENHLVNGLRYSIVDMNLDNGKGGITSKNIPILAPAAEKVTVGQHSNGHDIWIVAHSWGNNNFYSYLLSSTGLNMNPVISPIGNSHSGGQGNGASNNYTNAVGYLRFSPSSQKLALAIHYDGIIQLFRFDKLTGSVSQLLASTTLDRFVYGVEFSPNENILYASTIYTNSKLYQFDIQNNGLTNAVTIANPGNEKINALQLGPDGKIYISANGHYLGVIQNPDIVGISCNYSPDAIFLGTGSSIRGLPSGLIKPKLSLDFELVNTCYSNLQNFEIITGLTVDSIEWNFGDPSSGIYNISYDTNASHHYPSSGTYNVELSYFIKGIKYILKKDITLLTLNQVNLGKDTYLCKGEELVFDLSNTVGSIKWSDGRNDIIKIIKVPGYYFVDIVNSCGTSSDTVSVIDCFDKIEIPNVFTPNQDNINDYWIIKNIEFYPRVEVYIYTRWGNRIFKSRGYQYPWDGIHNGKVLPNGCYYYIILLNNGTSALTGHVSIYR